MPVAWRCRGCKGPPLAARDGVNAKPWIGPCPNCGGAYDADPVHVGAGECAGAMAGPIVDDEVMLFDDAVAQELADDGFRTISTCGPGTDWVLGGGLWPGFLILVAAPPGAGKSTWIVGLLRDMTAAGAPGIYCCTEESARQLGRRYARLGKMPGLKMVHATDLETIEEKLRESGTRVAAVDSLNDIGGVTDDDGFAYSKGSSMSVIAAASRLKQLAEDEEMAILAVGHVTKDGAIASTNSLQHKVDAILYINGHQVERNGTLVIDGPARTLSCEKTRGNLERGRRAQLRVDHAGVHDLGPWTNLWQPWESPPAAGA